MTSTIAALMITVLACSGLKPEPTLIVRGRDPARGVLVNRTPGLRPFDPPDRSLPTVVFVHGFNPAPWLVHFEMAQRLAESLAKRKISCNVLEWDWNAATFDSLSPRVNSTNSVQQGRLLAGELSRVGIEPSRIHLIGHSAGGMVATSAACVFATRYGRPVTQLTLLEPATYYHAVIFRSLQAGTLAPLVENYWSASPSAYGNEVRLPGVRDYRIDGRSYYFGIFCPIRSDHLFVFAWYLSTIEDAAMTGGFNTNQWSH